MRPDCPSACPLIVERDAALSLPPGQVRLLAPAEGGDVDETKRNVLKLLGIAGVAGVAGGGLVGGLLQYVGNTPQVGVSPPYIVQLLDVDGNPLTVAKVENEYNVNTGAVLTFNYPLQNEPNFLLNIQGNTQGIKNIPFGIGTEGTIVAYSAICQHLGCTAPAIMFYPPGTCPGKTFNTSQGTIDFFIHCSCHGSTYDAADQASNLTGPAIYPLPQVVLKADPVTGAISAVGMTSSSPPVNGHVNTYTGSYGVGSTSKLAKQAQGPVLCSFPG